MSDFPTPIEFVDPAASDPTYRVTLWAAPGEGKSVAAASAPAPILVLSADRPLAYRFARRHHGHTARSLREVRYLGPESLQQVMNYLRQPGCDVKTVVVDPVSHIVDQLAEVAPANREKDGPDYAWVNKQVLRFVKGLRAFDVNVVLVAHEKVNDGKKGDGKMYPQLGGMGLINKLLAEMDIVGRVERVVRTADEQEEPEVLWTAQLQPRGNIVCKESTGVLGDRRVADLSRWFALANEHYMPDDADIPFDLDDPVDPPPHAGEDDDPARDPAVEDELAQLDVGGAS